jgi:hypothetical protein
MLFNGSKAKYRIRIKLELLSWYIELEILMNKYLIVKFFITITFATSKRKNRINIELEMLS